MGTFDQAPTKVNALDAAFSDTLFDRMMNSTCDVYEKGQVSDDDSGQPNPDLTKLVTAWPCRLSILRGAGKEWETGKKYAENDYIVFMRPITVNDANAAFQLSPRHWLRVYNQDGTVTLVNLKAVNDPSGMGHHLECRGTEIVP